MSEPTTPAPKLPPMDWRQAIFSAVLILGSVWGAVRMEVRPIVHAFIAQDREQMRATLAHAQDSAWASLEQTLAARIDRAAQAVADSIAQDLSDMRALPASIARPVLTVPPDTVMQQRMQAYMDSMQHTQRAFQSTIALLTTKLEAALERRPKNGRDR